MFLKNQRPLRKKKGWNQTKLGRRCRPPLSQQQISLLERGLTPARMDQVIAIAEALGTTPDALCGRGRKKA